MNSKSVRAIPDGYHAVTPFVIVKGAAQFIDFMTEAFNAVEIAGVGDDGAIGHAEVRIGDSGVMTGVEVWSHTGHQTDEHAHGATE